MLTSLLQGWGWAESGDSAEIVLCWAWGGLFRFKSGAARAGEQASSLFGRSGPSFSSAVRQEVRVREATRATGRPALGLRVWIRCERPRELEEARAGLGGPLNPTLRLTCKSPRAAWGRNCCLHFSLQNSLEDSCNWGLLPFEIHF